MLSIDEAITHAREVAEKQRKDNDNCEYKEEYGCKGCADYYSKPCIECAEEHEQLAEWLEELKALRILLDWAIECGFGLDSFPDEYEQYKHTLTDDMNHTEMVKKNCKMCSGGAVKGRWK